MHSTDRFHSATNAYCSAVVELEDCRSVSSQGTRSMGHMVFGVMSAAALGMGMGLAIYAKASSTSAANLCLHAQSHAMSSHPRAPTSVHRPPRSVAASALGEAAMHAYNLPPTIAVEQVDSHAMRAPDLPVAPPLTTSGWPYTQQPEPVTFMRSRMGPGAVAGWAMVMGSIVLGAWALLVRRRLAGPQPLMQAVPVEGRSYADGYQSLSASPNQLVYEFNSEVPSPSPPGAPQTMGMRRKQPTSFVAETLLPTTSGDYRVRSYKHSLDGLTYTDPIAIVCGSPEGAACVPVRVHDACWTSEVIGSLKCDCAQQLAQAMDYIRDEGCGIVIYLHQEGRGIGLANKIAAYAVQETGADTVEANRLLGLPDDSREYTAVRDILADLGVKSVGLMTNNPRKVRELRTLGVDVDKRIACIVEDPGAIAAAYVQAKREQMGHLASDEENVSMLNEKALNE